MIARENGTVRFTHPLLASTIEYEQPAEGRRSMHARLAGLVDDPLGRARHLALAADRPDDDIAAALEQAAATAGARGAPLAAAEFAELALRLTPPDRDEALHRRTIAAARSHLAARDAARAGNLVRELLERSPPGRRRAEALLALTEIEHDGSARWLAVFRDVLRELDDEPALRARIHAHLAFRAAYAVEGVASAERHARASVELARGLDDEAVTIEALGALAAVRYRAGEADALDLAEEACERARNAGDPHEELLTRMNHAYQLHQTGRLEEARSAIETLAEDWARRSDWANLYATLYRAHTELHAGEFRLGADYARQAHELLLEYGQSSPTSLWFVGAYAAHRGELDEARRIAEAGSGIAVAQRAASEALLGCVELWGGDAREAHRYFAEAERVRLDSGLREPHSWWRAEYAEALLEFGRVEQAVALLDAWEADAARLGRQRALAQILRCRGLVAAARGEVGEALLLLEQAAERYEALGEPYGRGRALLALGRVRRRARQKRAAREAIEQAFADFQECGSDLFAAKARAELGSIGGRRREEGLTAAEQRVAALVAEGKTNREVAAALFLAERTVASHLSHAYAKLGVRSRTELDARSRRNLVSAPRKLRIF